VRSCIGALVYFDAVVERLSDRLTGPLPGAAAHAILAPQPRRQWPEGFNRAGIRDAAGLLLVFSIAGRPHIVLTLRAGTLGRHRGQVSLPGGVVEPGETYEQAALREAHEEVELPIADARVIGLLTPLDIPISGFRLYPVIASHATRPISFPPGIRTLMCFHGLIFVSILSASLPLRCFLGHEDHLGRIVRER